MRVDANNQKSRKARSWRAPTPCAKVSPVSARQHGIGGWRSRMELSQRGAAELLGVSLRAYQELERGSAFGSELPRVPDRRTMLALTALAAGLTPWPSGP